MGHRKGRRVRKIEVPEHTPTEFELGDLATDIQMRRRKERQQREREEEEEAQKQQRGRGRGRKP